MEANGHPIYLNQLRNQLLDALTEHGSQTFEELLVQGGGAFPTDVATCLKAMCNSNLIFFDGSRYQRIVAGGTEGEGHAQPAIFADSLPEAHPLDFDWRFTVEGREELIAQVCRHTTTDSKLALLGTPTIFQELAKLRPRTYLFDRNPALRAVYESSEWENSILVCDLRKPLNMDAGDFDFVLADPPWYPDYYEAFIDRAKELLRLDGTLFVSVLPWLTRPGASLDRASVVQHAFDRGFDIIAAAPGILHYESPRFEKAALETAGIEVSNWRRGDLFVFRKVGELSPEPRTSDIDESSWHRFVLGTVQVLVIEGSGIGKFEFSAVAPDGPVLSSVSRRSSLRRKIHIWTSGNLAYATTRPEVVRYCLERLQGGQSLTHVLATSSKELRLTDGEAGQLSILLGELVPSVKLWGATKQA
jgi:putative N6-adenine methyltransferase